MPSDFPPLVASVFATACLEQDYARAHACLSGPLRNRLSVSELASTLSDAAEDTATPARFRSRVEKITFAQWKRLNFNGAPEEATDENFVCWVKIRFLPEFDDPLYYACFDIWCLVIETEEGQKISFFEIMEPEH